MRHFIATLVVALVCTSSLVARAEVPSQFLAKMYSEALGRAPDVSGFQNWTNGFITNGCTPAMLQYTAGAFFDSSEYLNKAYTPEEQVLTIYRAVLSREPDATGFPGWVTAIKNGATPGSVARSIAASNEFASLQPAICAGLDYNTSGWRGPIDIGGGIWTATDLQNCLNASTICSIPPRTVIYLYAKFIIPAGKTLQTAGNPSHAIYARQARIVRAECDPVVNAAGEGCGGFNHLLVVGEGATLANIWVDDMRHFYKQNVLPTGYVGAPVLFNGGNSGTISGNRIEFSLGWSHIEANNDPLPSSPCTVSITSNLITGYTGSHYNDGTHYYAADGISLSCPNATVMYNDIVDITDVALIEFGRPEFMQQSAMVANNVVHAGLSASGSMVFETSRCANTLCAFSGSGISYNTILSGPLVHSDVALSLGIGPWDGTLACPDKCGSGGHMTNNVNSLGDVSRPLRVQVGVVVDGMLNADDTANALVVTPDPTVGHCPVGYVASDVSSGHASGHLAPYADRQVHGCIGH